LAYELEQLHIPHSIVMREPVPDRVAQAFLTQFLKAFAGGETLHLAVREARESLQGWEGEFPAASWLPIVFQNPAVPALTWQGLQGILVGETQPILLPRPRKLRHRIQLSIAASMAVTGLVLGVRYLGMLQPIELSAYDLLMRSRPAEKPDPRLLVVTVTEADLQSQTEDREPRRGSLSDRSLAKLLDKLIPAKPIAIGLDIYRDYPVSKTEPNLVDRLKNSDNIIGTCKVNDLATGDPGVAPPPEIAADSLGFSDILLDPDRIVRRHYLALEPPPISPCKSHYALSVQLALRYLAAQGINLQYLPNDVWKLGKLTFSPLETHSGGYQKIESSGHQILLNYRSTLTPLEIAPTVTLKEVLAGRISADVFKNRIVLIGTTAQSFHDDRLVPYTTDRGEIQSMSGVILQAQMVSQLLSAALDGRPLIQSCPFWVDTLWIWGFAVSGGLLVVAFRRPIEAGCAVIGTIAILSGTCLYLFSSGYWLPLVPAAIVIMGTASMTILIDRRMQNES
jgi:CHASE2 domain-containing sensor protein